jgi:hypothetical protein
VTATTPQEQLARLFRAHANIKARQAEANKKHKEANDKLNSALNLIETALMKSLEESGSSQLKVPGLAIAIPTKKIMPNCKDWPALWTFMKQTDNFDLVPRRLSATGVKEYMAAHDDALPPGIVIHVERGVSVRRQN